MRVTLSSIFQRPTSRRLASDSMSKKWRYFRWRYCFSFQRYQGEWRHDVICYVEVMCFCQRICFESSMKDSSCELVCQRCFTKKISNICYSRDLKFFTSTATKENILQLQCTRMFSHAFEHHCQILPLLLANFLPGAFLQTAPSPTMSTAYLAQLGIPFGGRSTKVWLFQL